jgi:putative transposase
MSPLPTPAAPTRKLLRLQTHNYSQPASYFITICTHKNKYLLGSIQNETIRLTPIGEIIRQTWLTLPDRFPRLVLDTFVIMPNHLHTLLTLTPPPSAKPSSPPHAVPPSLVRAALGPPGVSTSKLSPAAHSDNYSVSDIIRAFKSISAQKVNRLCHPDRFPLWHRSFHDHIIRDADDVQNIQRYILENPARWVQDAES